jgi:hypothetical protein
MILWYVGLWLRHGAEMGEWDAADCGPPLGGGNIE